MPPCTRVKQPKQDKTDVTIHLVMRFPKFHEDYCYLSILSSVLITVYTVYTQTLLGGSQHKIFNYITINYQLSIINYQLSAINYDYYPSRGSQHKIFYYIIINEVFILAPISYSKEMTLARLTSLSNVIRQLTHVSDIFASFSFPRT